jgi:hypothetical protein
MADFPAITPNARSLTLGNFPQGEYVGPSGVEFRVLYNSTKRVEQFLTLTFTAITETQANSITNHYSGQQGSLIAFALPSAVWSGYSSVPISASHYQWRYSGGFEVERAGVPGRFNVEVTLESSIV